MNPTSDTHCRRGLYLAVYLGSLIVGYLYLYFTEEQYIPLGLPVNHTHSSSECLNLSQHILRDDDSVFQRKAGRPYVIDLGFAHGLGHKLELQMLAMAAGLRGKGRFVGALWTAESGSGEHTDMITAAPLLGKLWGGNFSDEAAPELVSAARYSPLEDGSCPRRQAGKRVQGESGVAGATLDEMASFLGEGRLAIICPWFDKNAGGTPLPGEELMVRKWMRSRIVKEGKGQSFFVDGTDDILIAVHIRRGDLLNRQQHRMTRNHFFVNVVAHVLTELAAKRPAQVVVVSETWRDGGHECSREKKLCNHLGQSVNFEASLRKQVADLGHQYGRWQVRVHLDSDTARSFLTLVSADLLVLSSSGYSAWAGLLSTGIALYPADAKSQSVMRRMRSQAVSSLPVQSGDGWNREAIAREWSRYEECPARKRIRLAIVR